MYHRYIHHEGTSIVYITATMAIRAASHAGSWYSDHAPTLSNQLDEWLSQVDETIEGVGTVPQPGARVIVAP